MQKFPLVIKEEECEVEPDLTRLLLHEDEVFYTKRSQ